MDKQTEKTNKTKQNKQSKEGLNKDFLQAPNLTENMYREFQKQRRHTSHDFVDCF